jgi:hypothetical protein
MLYRTALAARSLATPQPFSWAPSQFFEGNDGSWSTFVIRVGTPAQTFRVLPSTAGQETWVPAPEECAVLNRSIEACGNMRGVQVFENAPSGGFMVNEVFHFQMHHLISNRQPLVVIHMGLNWALSAWTRREPQLHRQWKIWIRDNRS